MNSKASKAVAFVIMAGFIFSLVGAQPMAQDKESMNLGILLPHSGSYAWVGENSVNGIKVVQKEVEEVKGSTFTMMNGDTEGSPQAGLTAAKNLVRQGADILIGPTSLSLGGVLRYIRKEEQIPAISPTAGTTDLDAVGGEYIFRTVASDTQGAYALALMGLEKHNHQGTYEDLAFIYANAPAMVSWVDPVKTAVDSADLNLIEIKKVEPGRSSYRATITRVLNKDPEAIIVTAPVDDSVTIVNQARSIGFDGAFLFTQDQANQEFIDLSSEDVLHSTYAMLESSPKGAEEKKEKILSQLKEITGQEKFKIFTLPAYDAATIAALAYESAEEKTSEAIAGQINEVATPPGEKVESFEEGYELLNKGEEINYEGVTSDCDFNEYGDTITPFSVLEVHNGEWQEISTISSEEIKELQD